MTPKTELDPRFSSADATAATWPEAVDLLKKAQVYWLSTVRPSGQPHVTPLIAIWHGESIYFCTGPAERKAKNLASNPQCVITTGCNSLESGFDVVLEGVAVQVTDEPLLRSLASAWEAKYGSDWHFDIADGAFLGDGGKALVFEAAPQTVFGFAKDPYGQTRWQFAK